MEYFPYHATGKPYEVKNKQICYKLKTDEGQSGGPIIVRVGDEDFIASVHVWGT
jgi:hypothetical protein